MSAEQSATEALARIICQAVHPGIAKIARRDEDGCGYDGACGWCHEAAEIVLASDWLTEHTRQAVDAARAATLREVADDILRGTFTVEHYTLVAALGIVLRARASQIEGGAS